MKLKLWQIILIILVAVLGLGLLLSSPAPAHPYYLNAPRPLVIAHQGGDGLWPGDTLYAFEHAVDLGVDVLEMDAHITKDSQIVLMHDEKVDRTTDGTGLIEDMTLAQLRELDAAYQWSSDGGQTFPFRGQGIQVPTLEELFQKFPQMRYVIEIKLTRNPIGQPLCDLIRKYDMQDRVMVASFHDDAMSAFRQACPEVATSAAKTEVTSFVLLGKIFLSGLLSPKFESLQVPYETSESYGVPVMTERFIREAHARNVKVEPWTVNDPDLMKQYIAWGVDGLITDRPDLMLEVLGKK
ncbi:MAG: glycerophosphodiester phosphodiesterase [Chloroflexi bacterium]|nr:glycerophosphodiester phosphodiesterase [Chloroflexota bacterium]